MRLLTRSALVALSSFVVSLALIQSTAAQATRRGERPRTSGTRSQDRTAENIRYHQDRLSEINRDGIENAMRWAADFGSYHPEGARKKVAEGVAKINLFLSMRETETDIRNRNYRLALANAAEGVIEVFTNIDTVRDARLVRLTKLLLTTKNAILNTIEVRQLNAQEAQLRTNLDQLIRLQQRKQAQQVVTQPANRASSGPPVTRPRTVEPSRPTLTLKQPDQTALDDAVDLQGYKELGDRYFDGRPEARQRFLIRHPEYKKGGRALPSDTADEEQGGSDSSDDGGEMYEDNDATDMFGYMREGERYFANRPEDFKRFKERYPYYKQLTWEALSCSEARDLYHKSMSSLADNYNRRQFSCASINNLAARGKCYIDAESYYTNAAIYASESLKQADSKYKCRFGNNIYLPVVPPKPAGQP